MKRTRLEIIRDILNLTQLPKIKTRIVYQCNLNFKLVDKYISYLIAKGYMIKLEVENPILYRTTNKGLECLANLNSTLYFF